jgi:hypothetical protein
MRAATSTTYILPDLPWTALLPAITKDARAGDHIVVHTEAMHAAVAQALREAGRDDLTLELREPPERVQDAAA